MGALTQRFVDKQKTPAKHTDGDGLLLWVKSATSKSWVLRLRIDGKRKDIGLGPVKRMTLEQARLEAERRHDIHEAGGDPTNAGMKAERESRETAAQEEMTRCITFEVAARRCYNEKKGDWKNKKHRQQWINSLTTYAFPFIGQDPVAGITSGAIKDTLRKIPADQMELPKSERLSFWLAKPETARRVLDRIGTVLDWAVSEDLRHHPSPTHSIRKNMAKQAPKRNFPSMPFADVPGFIPELRAKDSMGRSALEFLILTATRSGEVRLGVWSEIDMDKALWTIPAARMKMNKPHAVPLSRPALAVLEKMKALHGCRPDAYVFPGQGSGGHLSDMTMAKLLRDAKKTVIVDGEQRTVVPHGFRSSFKVWASEETDYQNRVSEAALAHGNPDKVEAAYLRSDFFKHRVGLMNDWAEYLDPETVTEKSGDLFAPVDKPVQLAPAVPVGA